MSHRIFVALPISRGLQEKVDDWQLVHENIPARWVQGQNLHITLIPPWEEESVDNVIGRLSAIHGIPFTIEFQGAALIPNADDPHLIWMEETKKSPALYGLTETIELVLAGRMKERDLEFRPHLTLGWSQPESSAFFKENHAEPDSVSWQEEVTSFVLMESHRTEKGTRYEVLAEFPL